MKKGFKNVFISFSFFILILKIKNEDLLALIFFKRPFSFHGPARSLPNRALFDSIKLKTLVQNVITLIFMIFYDPSLAKGPFVYNNIIVAGIV